MLNCRRALLSIAIFCLLAWPGVSEGARTILPPGSPFVVDVWESLPQSSVTSVVQSEDGYLWLGTLNGLVRFDGLNFTLFDESNTGLNSSRVLALFEDSRARLWVGLENGNVSMIETNGVLENFTLSPGNSGGRLTICEDLQGVVWLLTGTGMLGQYRDNKLSTAFIGVGWKTVAAEEAGGVWIGTDDQLISLQSAASAFIVEREVPLGGRLDFVLASRTGGYWRLADGRVQKWRGGQRERDLGSYPWGSVPVLAACEDMEGNLIVGTYGDGVYWFQPDRKFFHLRAELSHPSVLALAMDREGNLWVGTNGGGLNRIKRRVFGVLPDSEGLVVQSVCPDPQNGLWIGYNGESRVDNFHNGTNRSIRIVQDPAIAANCDVKSVFVDGTGRVLAGLRFNGDSGQMPLRLFEFFEGRFRPVPDSTASMDNISVLFQDREGTLWAGGQNGLSRRDDEGWSFFTSSDGLAGDEVRAIAQDHDGRLWIATGSGLSRFDQERFTSFRKADGLPSDDLSCLLVDRVGELWVGTRGSGLARYHKGEWVRYNISSGLSGNSIGYLIEDGETNLWIGSNAGLMRVPRQSLDEFASGVADRVTCRTYVAADGLPARECTQGSQPAAARTEDGTLWFPTTKGLVFVHPSTLKGRQFHSPVVIESILVGNVQQITNRLRISAVPTIIVPPGKEHIEIQYSSLNLGSAAEQSRFRYQLENHDKDWNYVGDARVARFSNLSPGTYRFLVSAANEDGVWNPEPTVQMIEVEPPFWRTGWFLTVASLTLLGIVAGSVYYFSTQRLQRELAEFKRQEELEKERSRIARDLHDQLGANLTQVALLGELAEADKELPEQVEDHAKQIYETARETTKSLDEIVWAVNPSNDTLDGLVNYICKYAQEYYELAGLRYRIDVPADLPKLPLQPEVRHNVFLAAKEAVNNVVKHAQAGSAWLRLQMDSDRFTIEIEDDGRGLAGLDQKTGRNGLRNMRKRLEDIGGSFSIGPASQKGTVVRLSAPIKKN